MSALLTTEKEFSSWATDGRDGGGEKSCWSVPFCPLRKAPTNTTGWKMSKLSHARQTQLEYGIYMDKCWGHTRFSRTSIVSVFQEKCYVNDILQHRHSLKAFTIMQIIAQMQIVLLNQAKHQRAVNSLCCLHQGHSSYRSNWTGWCQKKPGKLDWHTRYSLKHQ